MGEIEEIEAIEDIHCDYKATRALRLAESFLKEGRENDASALLEHGNGHIRNGAAEAMARHYAENERWDGIRELLQSDDNDIWRGSYWAFNDFITKCESAGKLRSLQKTIENLLEDSKSRPLSVQAQYDGIFELVRDIDNRMDFLYKNGRISSLEWNRPRIPAKMKTAEMPKKNKLTR
ncbi:hypothetical protein H0O02_05400 [Candidatus Micrarchaeota archaeon]|nr:hypothetical protein [Candidatus Micrarchaeota archaeon]